MVRKQEVQDKEPLTQDEIDTLIMKIASRTRCHPDVVRGASVRGAIAFKEVVQGFNEIGKDLTRDIIQKAALVALPPRMSVKQGGYQSAVTVVDEIAREVLYGIRTPQPNLQTILAEGMDWMGSEDIATTLENLHLPQIYPEEKSELTQKEEAAIISAQQDGSEEPEHLQSQDFSQEENGNPSLSIEETLKHLIEELDSKMAADEITEHVYDSEKHKLDEMLKALSYIKSQMSDKELAETVVEIMDAQDKGWDKEVSQECMYIYYHMNGMQKGISLDVHKKGFYGLRVLIDTLVRQRILKTVTPGKAFNLTAEALEILLDRFIPRNWRGGELLSRPGQSKARVNEHQHSIRRYTIGDLFRDISVRHTLREIAKQKKKLSDVQRHDFRVFMKQSREVQSDIVFCVDTSGSMGFRRKLTYARLVAAGLARMALERGDRIGIVAFDDLGETVMPLTDSREEIFGYIAGLNVGGNTNIGDGIKCASRLLLDSPSHNQKHIVLITDGEPTAIEQEAFEQLQPARGEDLAEEYAILETRKASAGSIRTSVVHIADHGDAGEAFVKNVAMAGKGQIQKIDCFEELKVIMR